MPAHMRPAWHALFAPLPPDAVPKREPIVPPEILATAEGATLAGQDKVMLHLSAGCAGMRILMVTEDADGRLLSASDHVLHRRELRGDESARDAVEYRHEQVGGSFAPDGAFRGTRWSTVSTESAEGEQLEMDSTPSTPSEADEAALRAVAAEVVRRAPRHTA
jgi:hypothetical protein